MGSREQLTALLNGHRVAAAISAAVELGMVDLLAEGPRTADAVAAAAGTHPDATRRLLHALATFDLLEEDAAHTFALTELGSLLRSDAPASLAPLALVNSDPAIWASWGSLTHSIRTGETAFDAVNAMDVWAHRQRHPERGHTFNQLMTSLSSSVIEGVATSYDFGGRGHVVDVGGGQGTLLAAVLRGHPDVTGTVFDQAHVAPDIPEGLVDRWSAESGSFFDAVPPADCYLLKWILHDWDDDECVTILTRCRESLRPGGVVLVVELLLDRPEQERATAIMDLNMLAVVGGRERSQTEYAALFDRAGLRLTRLVDTGTPFAVLEAVAGG